jgi:hypothetical protein
MKHTVNKSRTNHPAHFIHSQRLRGKKTSNGRFARDHPDESMTTQSMPFGVVLKKDTSGGCRRFREGAAGPTSTVLRHKIDQRRHPAQNLVLKSGPTPVFPISSIQRSSSSGQHSSDFILIQMAHHDHHHGVNHTHDSSAFESGDYHGQVTYDKHDSPVGFNVCLTPSFFRTLSVFSNFVLFLVPLQGWSRPR